MRKTHKRRCISNCEFHEYLQIFNNLTYILFTSEIFVQDFGRFLSSTGYLETGHGTDHQRYPYAKVHFD